ncbi:MAG: sodium:alanine symporter family protein [Lachnospiraceae bacterium]|nr:sodium:alanine symporter family protein [Lachnospiraceae bacterium]
MLNNFIDGLAYYNGKLNSIVWGVPMLCLIIGVGIFYTIRTKFFQVTHAKDVYDNTIKGIINSAADKKSAKSKSNVLSQFQALSTALASTIGTGNMAGVSTAIVVGGPGAVFWMWICAIFGMATHFAEVILGIYYRNFDKENGYSGGPMYYLENGIGKELGFKRTGKVLAILFALFTFIASSGIGNMTQVNSISEALKSNFGISSIVVGVVLASLAGLIIFGGITRIGSVAERIVPFMAGFYILIGLIIVIINIRNVPHVFYSIFTSAFSFKAISGGVFGTVIKRAITYGFKRGAFSNEAGLGSSVIAHAASNEQEPVKQGLWGIFEVFFDTIIVCTFTSLIILSSSMNVPSLDDALIDLNLEEKYVCIDETLKNENDEVMLVDNNFYKMPFKIDSSGNAMLYKEIPDDLTKQYQEVNIGGFTYFVEMLDDKDANENSFFYGNILKIKPNPVLKTNGEILKDEDGYIVFDSIHIENVTGVSLVTLAVSNKLSHLAGKIIAIAVTLFAFTTVLGWSYYGTKTIEYIFGKISTYIYKVFYVIFIVVGSTMSLNLAWNISDTLNGLMAIPNLIGVFLLSGTVLKIVKNYYDRKNGKAVKPMISYK